MYRAAKEKVDGRYKGLGGSLSDGVYAASQLLNLVESCYVVVSGFPPSAMRMDLGKARHYDIILFYLVLIRCGLS